MEGIVWIKDWAMDCMVWTMLSFFKTFSDVPRGLGLVVLPWNIHNNWQYVNGIMEPIASIKNWYMDYFV